MKAIQKIIGIFMLLALIPVFARNGALTGLIVTAGMLPASFMFLKGKVNV